MTENPTGKPGIHFPPPFLFAAGVGAAWLLESYVTRIRFVGRDASTASIETAGSLLIALGLLLTFWAMVMFVRARTAIIPFKAASSLVETGPYRVSRNPMYTGLAIAYLGLMLILNWGWMLPIFPVILLSLYHLVIKKEERHLLAVFGEEYRSYCRRVRRWI